MNWRGLLLCNVAAAAVLATLAAPAARAADAIAEWTSIKAPPAPELKSVTLDPKTTALLILDINKPNCVPERRMRCVDTLPHIKKLMDGTGAAGAMRGFKVILPVDGMSADSAYMEQYVAFHFANAGTLSTQTTLTRSDMIKF